MPNSVTRRHLFALCVTTLFFALFSAAAILLRIYIKPARLGFYCEDTSIQWPEINYTETVKTSTLLIVNFSSAVFLIVLGEVLYTCCTFHRQPALANRGSDGSLISRQSLTDFEVCGYRVNYSIVRILGIFLIFLWGVIATSVITDTLKVSLGVLRPNFLALCRPSVNCELSFNHGVYHSDYVCQGVSADMEVHLRASFPSGHASQAAYTASFLSVYVQSRFRSRTLFFVVPFIQLSLVNATLWSAMTRITDHLHHPSDVFVGLLIGLATGLVLGLQGVQQLKRSDQPGEEETKPVPEVLASTPDIRSESDV